MTHAGFSFPTKIVAVGLCFGLAACESSGGSEPTVRDQPIVDIDTTSAVSLIPTIRSGGSLTFVQMQTLDDAISPIAETLFDNNPITPWEAVPTTGSADVYFGGIELLLLDGSDDRLIGSMNATTNFATSGIAGQARNFYSDAGEAHSGTLTLSANFFRGNDLTEEFGISGSLSGPLDGAIIDGPVAVSIGADFADTATVIYGGGIGTAAGQDIEANFVLSQN